jgi:hypothetical protein
MKKVSGSPSQRSYFERLNRHDSAAPRFGVPSPRLGVILSWCSLQRSPERLEDVELLDRVRVAEDEPVGGDHGAILAAGLSSSLNASCPWPVASTESRSGSRR